MLDTTVDTAIDSSGIVDEGILGKIESGQIILGVRDRYKTGKDEESYDGAEQKVKRKMRQKQKMKHNMNNKSCPK